MRDIADTPKTADILVKPNISEGKPDTDSITITPTNIETEISILLFTLYITLPPVMIAVFLGKNASFFTFSFIFQ